MPFELSMTAHPAWMEQQVGTAIPTGRYGTRQATDARPYTTSIRVLERPAGSATTTRSAGSWPLANTQGSALTAIASDVGHKDTMAAFQQFQAATASALADINSRLDSVSAALVGDSDPQLDGQSFSPAVFTALGATSFTGLLSTLGSDMQGDGWADFFDYIGDRPEIASPHMVEAAEASIHESLDFGVRAAAARALAAANPNRALEIISAAASEEPNDGLRQFYRAILKSISA